MTERRGGALNQVPKGRRWSTMSTRKLWTLAILTAFLTWGTRVIGAGPFSYVLRT